MLPPFSQVGVDIADSVALVQSAFPSTYCAQDPLREFLRGAQAVTTRQASDMEADGYRGNAVIRRQRLTMHRLCWSWLLPIFLLLAQQGDLRFIVDLLAAK